MTSGSSAESLRRQAASGDVGAMRQLGDALYERMRSRSDALECWRKAAAAGDLESMRRLARHESGIEDRERARGRLARAERGPRPDAIPTEATAAAAEAGLGRGVSTFGSFGGPGPDRSPQGCFVAVAVFVGLGIVLVIIGATVAGGARALLLIAGALLGLVGLVGWWAARRMPEHDERQRVARGRTCVFEGGLVQLPSQGPPQVYPWSRTRTTSAGTRHLKGGAYSHTTYSTTLVRDDGETIIFAGDTRFNLDDQILGEEIATAVTRVRVPATWEALARGERQTFGDITIDTAGIAVGDKSLSWDEVENIDLRQGLVRIRRRGGFLVWSRTPVSGIPDLRTFLSVTDDLRMG